jgi:hypothetical protein
MRRPLILYSTNTWLAFNIAERHYRGRHYIWCTPFFNGCSDKGEAGFVPPTSCPWEIYRSLYGEWRAGDRHSMKIAQNQDGILRGVQANRSSGVISERREREIASIVERADIRDFEPLVYVVPLRKGARPGQGSPGRGACAPSFPGVHHREPAAKIVRYNQARIVDRLPMDWSSKMGKFLDARPRDDVVEAVYLATRVMSHRAVLASRGISPRAYLARFPNAPPAGRRLASEILKNVVTESGPLDKIPQQTLDSHIMTLSQLMRSRLKRDLQYDEGRGRMLLEQMRKEDRLASRY